MKIPTLRKIRQRWHIAIRVSPFLIGIVLLKLLFHRLGWEIISLNPLFTSLVAGTTFLIGFLITGVISDYKESEKLPTEIAASIEVLHDETSIIILNKNAQVARDYRGQLLNFIGQLNKWFYKKERTENVLKALSSMNSYFAEFEQYAQANFITRMKQEQNNLRKYILRIHTVRETSFVQTAYTLVEVLSFFLISGLIFLKLEPFYESVFFVTLVSFLVLYMIYLIRDLDNPFDYSLYGELGSEISLKPIHDLEGRLKEKPSAKGR
jgi:hypothetical protein